MNARVVLEAVCWLSDQWLFVVGLPLLVGLVSGSTVLRPYTANLRFPVFLLLARKVALFVPVPGTISSTDRVVFWMREAYAFFLVALIAHALFFAAIRYRHVYLSWHESNSPYSSSSDREMSYRFTVGCGSIIGYLLLCALSGWLLPVAGLSHLYTPALYIAGVLKTLVASSLLLPLIWIGLALQISLSLTSRGKPGREINKMLVVCVLSGGFVENGLQLLYHRHSPVTTEIRTAWEVTNPVARQNAATTSSSPTEGAEEHKDEGAASKGTAAPADTDNFLGVWARKLAEIDRSGLNVVERNLPSRLPTGAGRYLVTSIPLPWNGLGAHHAAGSLLTGCIVFVLLMFLVERLRLPEERTDDLPEQARIGG